MKVLGMKIDRNLLIVVAVALLILICCFAARAGDYVVNVSSNTSTVVAPLRGIRNAPAFATNTAVTAGSIVKHNGRFYMAMVSGTTGPTHPTHTSGIVTDGTVTWLRVPYGNRESLSIIPENDGGIWYHDGLAATTNGGVFGYIKGQQYTDDTDAPVTVWTEADTKLNIKDR